jgi:hypothetical protein
MSKSESIEIMDNDSPFDIPERTRSVDDGYSILGRALAYATEYECNSRVLASLLKIKIKPALLDDDKILAKFSEAIWKKRLSTQISTMKEKLKVQESILKCLHAGRAGRNYIIHEAAIGAQGRFEKKGNRDGFFKELSKQVHNIAKANILVLIYVQLIANEPIPNAHHLKTYPDRITDWVCR